MALSTGSKVFLGILVVLVGIVGGALYYVNDQLSGEPGEGEPVALEVESGDTVAGLSEELVELGVIKNALAFRLIARNSDVAANLRPGTYELETGMSVDEAINAMEGGPSQAVVRDTIRFGFPEGLALPLTLEAIAADVEQYGPADFEAVLQERLDAGENAEGVLQLPDWYPALESIDVSGAPAPMPMFEGLLFPETYEVFAEVGAVGILQRTVDQLAQVMDSIPQEQVDALAERGIDRYQAMIVASLIERETRVDAERPMVASVIYNRLDAGQPLQIDATVLYALGQWQERVLTEDTNIDSRWNTYNVQGLPPTPISGFGRASLEAAFNPEDTGFFYYVVSPECDGTHNFAETLDEHNRNVQAYRDAGRCESDGG